MKLLIFFCAFVVATCFGASNKTYKDTGLTIVILGASGDLSRKKTYPSFFQAFSEGLLPSKFEIVGVARSSFKLGEFHKMISGHFQKEKREGEKREFLSHCTFYSGQLNEAKTFERVVREVEGREGEEGANRVFILALPPSVFVSTTKALKESGFFERKTRGGEWRRVVVEKPIGEDTLSSSLLTQQLLGEVGEEESYRIDHYLGKEVLQNIVPLRFQNSLFEPFFHREKVERVELCFFESIGIEGRGYFDSAGIIRDVVQNHLLQFFALISMEKPSNLSLPSSITDAKVAALKSIPPFTEKQTVVGQYEGYLNEPNVPPSSFTETFVATVVRPNSERWRGVPFILKAGKALNQKLVEARIFLKNSDNQLVFRVQPDEAVFFDNVKSKLPGLTGQQLFANVSLKFEYKQEFKSLLIPDAYAKLYLDVIQGNKNHFVRNDELLLSWQIVTPLLQHLKQAQLPPLIYPFGSSGPPLDSLFASLHSPPQKDHTDEL